VTAVASSTANNQLFQITLLGPLLAGLPQPLMTINTSGLTASANIVLGSVSTTTPGSAAVTINAGGTVTLDNAGINNTNRINDTAVVAFNGGTLNFLGGSGVASTEALGTGLPATVPGVVFLSGNSTIQTTAGAGGSVVLTANLVNRA